MLSPFLSTLLANVGIAVVLLLFIFVIKRSQGFLTRNIKSFTAFTVGILLSLVFLDLLPELSEEMEGGVLGLSILVGLLIFYVLELFLHWHHCNDLDEKEAGHSHANDDLMMVNTFFHNSLHGVFIFSGFALSLEAGILLSIAVLLHALPQNIANFIMNRKKIQSIVVAAVGGVVGALLMWPLGEFVLQYQFIVLAAISGGLLYIALTDILPSVNLSTSTREKGKYFIFVLLGMLVLAGFQSLIL